MRRRRWLRLALAGIAFLLVASAVFSRALEDGWARRSLLARLSASFGRPVQVGSFGFSLLDGPRLEADSVTVAEDPAFGNEYFLRADQLAVSLRWSALLHGRLEFGTVSFDHPSLNLVRNPDGRWNIESWLPPPVPAGRSSSRRVPVRLTHIAIDSGRINFKRGNDKLPFALVDVSGRLDQDSAGRWHIDLRADPMRAPVALQDAGTFRLRGTVAGTSARLRPAELSLAWQDASLADALRLAQGSDLGVRGTLSAQVSAAIHDSPAPGRHSLNAVWDVSATVRVADVHRWDLPARPTDPALLVTLGASWRPGERDLKFTRCLVEAPHSRLAATGDLDWANGFDPRLQLVSSGISLQDLGVWRSTFLPRLAAGLRVQGTLGLDATLQGWPLRVTRAAIAATGADLRFGSSSPPIRVGRIQATLRNGSLVLDPVTLILPESPETHPLPHASSARPDLLRVEGALGPLFLRNGPLGWPYRLAVSGKTVHVRDLGAVAAALGWKTWVGWKLEGPASVHLALSGTLPGGPMQTRGTLELHRLRLTSVLLNHPLMVSSASVTLRPGERLVRLAGVQAFGAQWKGTVDWSAAQQRWAAELYANHLTAADLDRWLGPRARPSFLERMLPFAVSSRSAPARASAIAHLQARGTLRVGDLRVGPLHVHDLATGFDLDGRDIVLSHAQAAFYGGRVDGQFEAQLSAQPTYTFHGRIERANLAALTAATDSLAGRFGGIASGELALAARGIGRKNLVASLEGEGDLRIHDAVVRRFGAAFGPVTAAGSGELREDRHFPSATTEFRVVGGTVRLTPLLLTAAANRRFEVAGTVDFSRRLDLTIRSASLSDPSASDPAGDGEGNSWTVGGSLDAPQLTRQTRIARDRAVRAGAQR